MRSVDLQAKDYSGPAWPPAATYKLLHGAGTPQHGL